MFTRLTSAAPVAALLLAAAAFSAPARADVSWSVGINAPIAPGVHVGTVFDSGGHGRHPGSYRPYGPTPVVYAPPVYGAPPAYAPPVYVAPPAYAPAPLAYAPPPMHYYAPRPMVHRAPMIGRPGHLDNRPRHPYQPQGHRPGRGGGRHG